MYRIELYWTDMDGLPHVKGYFNMQEVIDFVVNKEYLDISANVAFGTPPKLDVELISFDNSKITYMDVCIEKAVELYNKYKNTARVYVVLHPKEREEMKTENNWEHYNKEIFEKIKDCSGTELSCSIRKWLGENGHAGCDDFPTCGDCRLNMVRWFEKLYEPPEALENGDNLKPGDWIRASNICDCEKSYKVQFLGYFNGKFYTSPPGCTLDNNSLHYSYSYAWALG